MRDVRRKIGYFISADNISCSRNLTIKKQADACRSVMRQAAIPKFCVKEYSIIQEEFSYLTELVTELIVLTEKIWHTEIE